MSSYSSPTLLSLFILHCARENGNNKFVTMKSLHNEQTQDKFCCFIMAAGLSVEVLWQHIRKKPF